MGYAGGHVGGATIQAFESNIRLSWTQYHREGEGVGCVDGHTFHDEWWDMMLVDRTPLSDAHQHGQYKGPEESGSLSYDMGIIGTFSRSSRRREQMPFSTEGSPFLLGSS